MPGDGVESVGEALKNFLRAREASFLDKVNDEFLFFSEFLHGLIVSQKCWNCHEMLQLALNFGTIPCVGTTSQGIRVCFGVDFGVGFSHLVVL